MSSGAGRRDVGEHVWLIAMAAAGAVPAGFLAAKGGVEVLLLPAALAGILVLLPRPDLAAQTLAFVLYLNASDVLIERNGWPSLDKGLVVLVATAVVLRWWASGRRPGGDPQTVAVLAIYAAAIAALAAYLAFSEVLHASYQNYLWLLIGTALAAAAIADREDRS